MKKAVATLLAWETAENEEEIESEEEEESEDEDESEQGSTSSSFESLRERYGVSKEDEEEGGEQTSKVTEWSAATESGRYILRAIVGQDEDGWWVVLRRQGPLTGDEGLLIAPEDPVRLEGMRLELWERV